MKTFLLTGTAMLLALALKAQNNNYQVTVKLPAVKAPATVYLIQNYGWTNNKLIDSAKLTNGTVTFKGTVTEPIKTHLLVNHSGKNGDKWMPDNDALLLYLEPANITVTARDSVKSGVVTGSVLNNAYNSYYKKVLAGGDKELMLINNEYLSKSADQRNDKAYQASLMARMGKINKRNDSLKLIHIKQNPNDYFSLEALQELTAAGYDITRLTPLFKALNPSLRNSSAGKKVSLVLEEFGLRV